MPEVFDSVTLAWLLPKISRPPLLPNLCLTKARHSGWPATHTNGCGSCNIVKRFGWKIPWDCYYHEHKPMVVAASSSSSSSPWHCQVIRTPSTARDWPTNTLDGKKHKQATTTGWRVQGTDEGRMSATDQQGKKNRKRSIDGANSFKVEKATYLEKTNFGMVKIVNWDWMKLGRVSI